MGAFLGKQAAEGFIARRLFVQILLLSLLATVVISALQLRFRYGEKIESIEEDLERVAVSRLNSLAAHLWLFDEVLLRTELEGVMNLPNIQFVEVRSIEGQTMALGSPGSENRIEREYPLVYSHRGKEIELGKLKIHSTPDLVWRQLLDDAAALSLGEASKVFVIALLVFVVFQMTVGRHLRGLALQARDLDLGRPHPPFNLNRRSRAGKTADELEYLVSALNALYGSLRGSIEDLHRSNEKLDEEIRERERADEELAKAHALLEETQAIGKLGGWEYDIETGRVSWTREVYRIYGVERDYDPSDVGRDISFYAPEDAPVLERAFHKAVELGERYDLECRFISGSGERLWVRTIGKPVVKGDKIARVVGILMDVTERIQAEEALRSSLEEKESLLREVHHRVKNNLQIISSLLSLQARQVPGVELHAFLRDTQNRVRSMALLHETLYRSGNLAKVSFPRYVRSVCDHVARSFASEAGNIRLLHDIADVALDLDQAIPTGLIISELVSNAFKHAFPSGSDGEILVRLQAADEHHLILRVSDSGVGFPAEMGPQGTETLGLRLVRSLCGQMDGQMSVSCEQGTVFQIVFPVHSA